MTSSKFAASERREKICGCVCRCGKRAFSRRADELAVCSTPNVTTALIEMSKAAHVEEKMELSRIEPVSEET